MPTVYIKGTFDAKSYPATATIKFLSKTGWISKEISLSSPTDTLKFDIDLDDIPDEPIQVSVEIENASGKKDSDSAVAGIYIEELYHYPGPSSTVKAKIKNGYDVKFWGWVGCSFSDLDLTKFYDLPPQQVVLSPGNSKWVRWDIDSSTRYEIARKLGCSSPDYCSGYVIVATWILYNPSDNLMYGRLDTRYKTFSSI